MKNLQNIHMQGDIQLVPCGKIEGEEIKHNGEYVLLWGETTGHKHLLKVKDPEKMRIFKDSEGRLVLELLEEGTLTHEEHGTHIVTPGWYRMNQEQEYDYFEMQSRTVID